MALSLARVLHRTTDRTVDGEAAEQLVRRVFRDHPAPDFRVRLWDGREVVFGNGQTFTLHFRDRDAFRECATTADPAAFAEAYVEGRLTVEGDLAQAIGLGTYLRTVELGAVEKIVAARRLGVPASRHTVRTDTANVRAHYDLSNEFFQLFLDDRMVYSCAYFRDPGESLEDAQARKLDLVCRKLRLRPGERFLDIGCGWGALVIWAASHYGVRAHGITLSKNQASEARRRVAEAGLKDRVTIEERHYLDLPAAAFDKVASVGMYEHVGLRRMGDYLGAVRRTLDEGGLFLNHGITQPPGGDRSAGGAFVFRHVFPGAELDSVSHLQATMEEEGFEILDVEALRRHYALTLRAWYRRFAHARDRARGFVPERVLRIWDIYLAGCAEAFEGGVVGVHQVLAARREPDGHVAVPLTRADLVAVA